MLIGLDCDEPSLVRGRLVWLAPAHG